MATGLLAASTLVNMGNRFNSAFTQLSDLSPVKLLLLARHFQQQASKYNKILYITGVVTVITGIGSAASFIGANSLSNSYGNSGKKAFLMIAGIVCMIVAFTALSMVFVTWSKTSINLSCSKRCLEYIELNKNISS
ncbi:MAG: hypothetical protein K1060chlam2_00793 [Chlamydiae bacterium]|nr:hypothetical protein [Chlamydiota bacterium]